MGQTVATLTTAAAKPQQLASTLFFQKVVHFQRKEPLQPISYAGPINTTHSGLQITWISRQNTLFMQRLTTFFFSFVSESVDAAKSQKPIQCLHLS